MDRHQGGPRPKRLRLAGGLQRQGRACGSQRVGRLHREPGRDCRALRPRHDGAAADIVERYAPEKVRADLVPKLRSLDPDTAWEGGMFLTERQGGSDVGANTTTAVQDGDEWRLTGEKHFCSNVDAEVFIVLARPEGAPAGSRGLGTFIVPRLLDDGTPNGFTIKRLKPKLGTRGVPTAEVSLDHALGWLAGAGTAGTANGADSVVSASTAADAARDGRGINRMMEMVNGSRFGVALMGLGIHRRSFLEAAIYAARRVPSSDSASTATRSCARPSSTWQLSSRPASEAYSSAPRRCAPLRIRNPGGSCGGFSSRSRSSAAPASWLQQATTAPEAFGGNGYMEDWPMARQLRDGRSATPSGKARRTSCASTSGA